MLRGNRTPGKQWVPDQMRHDVIVLIGCRLNNAKNSFYLFSFFGHSYTCRQNAIAIDRNNRMASLSEGKQSHKHTDFMRIASSRKAP